MSPETLPHPELSSKLCNLLSTQEQASFNHLTTVPGCSCKLQLYYCYINHLKLMLNPKQELKWVLKINVSSSVSP